jgi:hypothetical protein
MNFIWDLGIEMELREREKYYINELPLTTKQKKLGFKLI